MIFKAQEAPPYSVYAVARIFFRAEQTDPEKKGHPHIPSAVMERIFGGYF